MEDLAHSLRCRTQSKTTITCLERGTWKNTKAIVCTSLVCFRYLQRNACQRNTCMRKDKKSVTEVITGSLKGCTEGTIFTINETR